MRVEELANHVCGNFQQIHKSEIGLVRVSSSTLWNIALALDVPISFFFEGLDGQPADAGSSDSDIEFNNDIIELLRAYQAIPEGQRWLLNFARLPSDAA